eukprot:353654-Chlamydomonas_euryale.AAC.5
MIATAAAHAAEAYASARPRPLTRLLLLPPLPCHAVVSPRSVLAGAAHATPQLLFFYYSTPELGEKGERGWGRGAR